METLKNFIIGLFTKTFGMVDSIITRFISLIETSLDTLKNHIANPTQFVIMAILLTIGFDTILVGKLGVIDYIIKTTIIIIKEGGWQLIAFLALIAVLLSKK